MKTIVYTKGMHCKSCEQLVTEELTDQGAKNAKADFKTGIVEVDHDEALTIDKIKQIIKDEGYEVKL